jgi:uncharacterized protein (DUF1330 family)
MAAFIVLIREKTRDQSEIDTYMPKAKASFEGHPVTMLARLGSQEVLEGPEPEGVFILSFPSLKDAKAWYDSPAYKEARKHRFLGADYRTILVEGV